MDRKGSRAVELNSFLSRNLVWIVCLAIAVGALFNEELSFLSELVPYALAGMIFLMGTSCSLGEFRRVFSSPKSVLVGLLIIYAIIPLFAFAVSRVFYDGTNPFPVGHILVGVTPVAISSTVWTGMAKGDISLALSLVTVVTLLSGFTVPTMMAILAGEIIEFDSVGLMFDLIKMIIIPSILGIALKHRAGDSLERYRPQFGCATKFFILIILVANGAVVRPYLGEMGTALIIITLASVVQLLGQFALSYLTAGFFMGFSSEVIPTLTYLSMKNNGAGLVIAMAYFGPLVALPVVLNIVFQQFFAGLALRLFHFRREQGFEPGEQVSG